MELLKKKLNTRFEIQYGLTKTLTQWVYRYLIILKKVRDDNPNQRGV